MANEPTKKKTPSKTISLRERLERDPFGTPRSSLLAAGFNETEILLAQYRIIDPLRPENRFRQRGQFGSIGASTLQTGHDHFFARNSRRQPKKMADPRLHNLTPLVAPDSNVPDEENDVSSGPTEVENDGSTEQTETENDDSSGQTGAENVVSSGQTETENDVNPVGNDVLPAQTSVPAPEKKRFRTNFQRALDSVDKWNQIFNKVQSDNPSKNQDEISLLVDNKMRNDHQHDWSRLIKLRKKGNWSGRGDTVTPKVPSASEKQGEKDPNADRENDDNPADPGLENEVENDAGNGNETDDNDPPPPSGTKRKRGGHVGPRRPRKKRAVDSNGNPVLDPGPYRNQICVGCMRSMVHGSSWGECTGERGKPCRRCAKTNSSCYPIPDDLIKTANDFIKMTRSGDAKPAILKHASTTIRTRVNEFDALRKQQKKQLKTNGNVDPSIRPFGATSPVRNENVSYETNDTPETRPAKRLRLNASSQAATVRPAPARDSSAVIANRTALRSLFTAAAGSNQALVPAFDALLLAYEKSVQEQFRQ